MTPNCANLTTIAMLPLFGDNGLELLYERTQQIGRYRCYCPVRFLSDVTFRWYVNGRSFSDQRGTHRLQNLSNGSLRLIVESTQDISSSGVIACELLSSFQRKITACLASVGLPATKLSTVSFTIEMTSEKDEMWDFFWSLFIGSMVLFLVITSALVLFIKRRCKLKRYLGQQTSDTRLANQRETRAALPETPWSAGDPVYDLPDEIGQPKGFAIKRQDHCSPKRHLDVEACLEVSCCHSAQIFVKESSSSRSEHLFAASADVGDIDRAATDQAMIRHPSQIFVRKSSSSSRSEDLFPAATATDGEDSDEASMKHTMSCHLSQMIFVRESSSSSSEDLFAACSDIEDL